MDTDWETNVIEFSAVNITGFRIIDESRSFIKQFLDSWKKHDISSHNAPKRTITVREVRQKKNIKKMLNAK